MLVFHLKKKLVDYIEIAGEKKPELPETPGPRVLTQTGPKILTTKELNDSSLLNSPLSDTSVNYERIFSNEEEIIMDHKIRKFVLKTSKLIFKEWFKSKTTKEGERSPEKPSTVAKGRKRVRRLKRIDDL